MRIWSDTLTAEDISKAADRAGVQVTYESGKARKRAQRFTIALTGDSWWRSQQQYLDVSVNEYAATWDQWGIFLGALFEADSELTTEYYKDWSDFHERTQWRFQNAKPYSRELYHRRHKWQPAMIYIDFREYAGSECECGAEVIWRWPDGGAHNARMIAS